MRNKLWCDLDIAEVYAECNLAALIRSEKPLCDEQVNNKFVIFDTCKADTAGRSARCFNIEHRIALVF